MTSSCRKLCRLLQGSLSLAALMGPLSALDAAPTITRLTPPSDLFSFGDPSPPIIARFLPGQRFDLQATVRPDIGQTITKVEFLVDGAVVASAATLTPATTAGQPPTSLSTSVVATHRAYSHGIPGVHLLTARATQSNGLTVTADGNFEIVSIEATGDLAKAKNVIFLIGDGMGIAHRTAARIMLNGVSQGKALAPLAMDQFPVTGLAHTASLNSIITDSSPGAAVYSTGNKGNNNQQAVFPDDTADSFDNPRVELIGEYLARTQGKTLGIVTTSDIFDATPGAFGTHTANRGAGTGIVDQYLDEAVAKGGLRVLLGGGRRWFLPSGTPGSSRSASNDYVLPQELATAWGVARGAIDPERDLISDFQQAGFAYVGNATQLKALPANTERLLGLFNLSNMTVALDKINGRRGRSQIAADFGFPDQPMLDEMTDAALAVLQKNPAGFVLMVEAASIDKQAHNMDTERWILDTIEFDRAIERVRQFVLANPNTLAIITADHECAGVNIIGASRISDPELTVRAGSGDGAAALREPVVGVYEQAGFPVYDILPDGYPNVTDVNQRMLIGYAANADRYEDWRTNPQPLRDTQQPLVGQPPLSGYPGSPTQRDVAGGYLVTGQVPGGTAVHTASDIPVSAIGVGAGLFTGSYDNTDVFFRAMRAVLVGAPADVPPPPVGQRTASDRLVNVSNRGWVGTGLGELTTGFVIHGSRPRTLLIRGIGPTLASFGLGENALNDPVLRITNSSGVLISFNDSWEANTNLNALKSVTALTGAFPLPAGSKDAAVLVTLIPGAYSVQVAGKDNTTGIALIEVYEAP